MAGQRIKYVVITRPMRQQQFEPHFSATNMLFFYLARFERNRLKKVELAFDFRTSRDFPFYRCLVFLETLPTI